MPITQPDFGDFLRKIQMRHDQPKKKPSVRKPLNNNRADLSKPATASRTVQPPSGPPGPSVHQGGSPASGAGGTCPLRKFLGPSLSSVIFNSVGGIQCPAPIIQARAALAATAPIQQLRPQALPVKFLAVGAMAAALNVPCGMWREHTEKFSGQWFMAVHASIPFIAMLRKAVIMPKIAIACTIACAIAGQAIGARLERQRLAKAAAVEAGRVALAAAPGVTAVEDLAHLQTSARKVERRRQRAKVRSDAPTVSSHGRNSRTDKGQPASPEALGDGSAHWLTEVATKVDHLKKFLALPQAPQPVATH